MHNMDNVLIYNLQTHTQMWYDRVKIRTTRFYPTNNKSISNFIVFSLFFSSSVRNNEMKFEKWKKMVLRRKHNLCMNLRE